MTRSDTVSVHCLPISVFIIVPATFLISYCIAVSLNHVEPGFPYISDTGARSPESCIFGQFLNIAALLAGLNFYIRYRQIDHHLLHHPDVHMFRANRVALGLGFTSALGISIVGNFQETNVLVVHLIGAVMAFGVGCVYSWVHVYISYKTSPLLTSSWVCHLRVLLSFLVSITFAFTFIFDAIAKRQFQGSDPRKWYPKDGGFTYHVVSTASEWVMSLCLLIYFLSFTQEFRRLRLTLPRVVIMELTDSGLIVEEGEGEGEGEREGF